MTVFAWHVHHNRLMEPLTEPIETRIGYIKTNKPGWEVSTRLRLLKVVAGKLPAGLCQARDAYINAEEARRKVVEDYGKAVEARDLSGKVWELWEAYNNMQVSYDNTWELYRPEIEALHKMECPDCPWDGKTIFPKQANLEAKAALVGELVETLKTILATICDKELCGHFTAEEIRECAQAAIAKAEALGVKG